MVRFAQPNNGDKRIQSGSRFIKIEVRSAPYRRGALHSDPADPRTLAQWAAQLHSTELTLARRCLRELGMSFGQWRARLRLIKALAWLKEDLPVQEVSWRLGYGSTSAFIAMFNRELGCSPQRYRQQLGSRREV